MPPLKGAQEKPKSKKELRAEQEAAARAAEEERLRQEEEERRVAEQAEQRRHELLAEYTAQRDARLSAERQKLVPLLQDMQRQRDAVAASAAAVTEWEQYLLCSPLPNPCDRPAMNDFLNSVAEDVDASDLQTLRQCEACIQLAERCLSLAAEADMKASLQEALESWVTGGSAAMPSTAAEGSAASGSNSHGDSCDNTDLDDAEQQALCSTAAASATAGEEAVPAEPAAGAAVASWDATASAAAISACHACAAEHRQDALSLYEHIKSMIDSATAHVLLHADEFADPKGDVLVVAQEGQQQWGLWANTQKNPRFKLIEFTGLGITVEIPKQLALANIAIRVQRHPFCVADDNNSSSAVSSSQPGQAAHSCLAPLGGILQTELLALPPPPKHNKGWAIRQVSAHSSSLTTVPYPMPPVGADPNTWRPDEEPPPLHFTVKLPERLLVPAAVRVGWWDTSRQAWSEEGISNTSYDAVGGRLSFSSLHLGSLALLQDTTAHLPYASWTIRPTGGLGGSSAAIDLQVPCLPSNDSSSSNAGARLTLEVGSGWVKLCGPSLPQLAHLLGRALPPWELLSACEACGLRLTPGSSQAAALGLLGKQPAGESAMCTDVAMLCTKFLVASSRWNRGAEQDVLLVRLSEVTDWEEGGRTSSQAAARIFTKEATDGPRQVLFARREGAHGVSWAHDGGDNHQAPPPPLDLSTVDAVQGAMMMMQQDDASCMHVSLLHLLAKRSGGDASMLLFESNNIDAVFVGSMVQMLKALGLFVG